MSYGNLKDATAYFTYLFGSLADPQPVHLDWMPWHHTGAWYQALLPFSFDVAWLTLAIICSSSRWARPGARCGIASIRSSGKRCCSAFASGTRRASAAFSARRGCGLANTAEWMASHQLDAFAWLEQLEEYGAQYRLDRLIAHSLADQIQRHLECGQHTQAQALLVRLEALGEGIDASMPGTRARVAVQALRGRVLCEIAGGEGEGAAARIQQLIEACDAHGWQRDAAHFQLLGAVVDQRRRQAATSALRRGHRLGLMRSMLDVGPDVLALIVDAAPSDPADAVLPFYASRLLSERETGIVQLLVHAIPNKRIARALSIPPETVKWHLKKHLRQAQGVEPR